VEKTLSGKSIIVVGAGWIGGTTAAELARQGAAVTLGDVDQESAERSVADIRQAGGTAQALRLDLADESSIHDGLHRARDVYGRIDGLHLNGADRSQLAYDADAVDVPRACWDRTLEVNLTGYFLGIRHMIPLLLGQGGGSIVCTSSTDAFGVGERVAYSVSKAGILALVRHAAARWGRLGIRVNAVAPGAVPHRYRGESESDPRWQIYMTRTPSPRLGHPEDVAGLVSFLLSDAASWINGQVISVDGGMTMSRG
jgi:NAD(P)-dependent dehydrogenase (short-subunit alcohol dehydrogenase family)